MNEGKVLTSEKGFTLIELLITAAVAAIVVVGFVGSSLAIQKANTAAFERTVALQDANQVIELMRNTAASGTFPGNVTSAYSGSVSGYSNLTNESVSVSYASSTANPLDVTVTVTYKEHGIRTTSAALRTYITQRA